MLVGILSDTHDKLKRTTRAVALLCDAGAEVLFHCGDITQPDIVWACADLPCHFVFGNNDYDVEELRTTMKAAGASCLDWGGQVTLHGKRIAVLHGDRQAEFRRLLRERPDYLLQGHTHEPQDEHFEGTRIINPGALHRAAEHTVALLDLEADELRFLSVE